VDNTPGDKLGVWRDMRLADALVLVLNKLLPQGQLDHPVGGQSGFESQAGKEIS